MGVAGGDCGLPDWLAAKPFSREVAAAVWRSPEKSRRGGEVFPAREEVGGGVGGGGRGRTDRGGAVFSRSPSVAVVTADLAGGAISRGDYKKTIRG